MEEKNSNENKRTLSTAIVGGVIIAVLLILSTLWINQRAQDGTNDAVQSVSEFYLRELTARREQVVTARINVRIDNMKAAIKIMSPNDLLNVETLSTFLGKMKTLCSVDQFAFANANGVVFTSEGIAPNTADYFFINDLIAEPKIFTLDISETHKNVSDGST